MVFFRRFTQIDKLTLISVLIPILIALTFLAWGLTIYFVVGTKNPFPWYFGSVQDVPGQSSYSTSTARNLLRNTVSPEDKNEVIRQHVKEQKALPIPIFARPRPEGQTPRGAQNQSP